VTDLYHYGARYYDPNIGRFTSPDPSGQEQNPYLYAEGDPVNRIDPNGLLSFGDVVGGVVGAVASAALDGVLGPVAGGAIGGCIGGGITAAIDGSSVAQACLEQGALGAATGGAGALTKVAPGK
jgi:uncharacterized protein RhaS with RHS repeats